DILSRNFLENDEIFHYKELIEMLSTRLNEYSGYLDFLLRNLNESHEYALFFRLRDFLESYKNVIIDLKARCEKFGLKLSSGSKLPSSHLLGKFYLDYLALINPVLDFNTNALDVIKIISGAELSGESPKDRLITIFFNEIFEMEMVKRSGKQDFISELICYLIEVKLISIKIKEESSGNLPDLRKSVSLLIKKHVLDYIKEEWSDLDVKVTDSLKNIKKISGLIPKLLKMIIDDREKLLMEYSSIKGIKAGEDKLKQISSELKTNLNTLKNAIEQIQDLLLKEHSNILKPVITSFKYQVEDISRFTSKMVFFFQEIKNQEEKIKIREETEGVMVLIDKLIKELEKDVGAILGGKYIDIEALNNVLLEFNTNYKDLLSKLNNVLRKHDAFKLILIIEPIKEFLKKRTSTIVLIKNMILVELRENVRKLMRLMDDISESEKLTLEISLEKGKLDDADSFLMIIDDITSMIDDNLEDREKIDDSLLKKQISMIEERLSQLETIKKNLDERKDKLVYLLLKDDDKEKFKEEHKIDECIICYEPITTLDEDKVIVCPYCGRMGHYLCLAWWLEKHGICPVCHGKLVTPKQSTNSSFIDDSLQ
ncbi:MAG: RING finger domain-containing protein, partial [Promethearchaeota archaeon]